MSVGEMVVGEMGVGEMSEYQKFVLFFDVSITVCLYFINAERVDIKLL